MGTKKSSCEIEMKKFLAEGEEIIDDSELTTKEARKVLDLGYKVLQKCEELRLSRDKWTERATIAENKLKELKK